MNWGLGSRNGPTEEFFRVMGKGNRDPTGSQPSRTPADQTAHIAGRNRVPVYAGGGIVTMQSTCGPNLEAGQG